MKILHTADWHLGGSRKGPTVDGKNLRLEDTKNCIESVIEQAEKEEPDVILISGDIFDTCALYEDKNNHEIEDAYRYITMLSMICPVVVMRGTPNHDGESRFSLLREVLKNNPDVHIVTEPEIVELDTVEGSVNIAAVPGFDRGVFRAKYPGASKEEENEIFTQELTNIVLGLRASCAKDAAKILMAHYTVPGSNMESGQVSFYNKSEPVLLQETLKAAGFDLVCMGHIHRPQLVEDTDNVFYSGAVNTITFNDENQDRGFWLHILEHDVLGKEGVLLTDSQFRKTPYREMLTIRLGSSTIGLLNDAITQEDTIAFLMSGYPVEGKMVRVLYECTEEQRAAFNSAILEKALYEYGAFWVAGAEMVKTVEAVNREELDSQTDPYVNLERYLKEKGYEEDVLQRLLEKARPIIDKAVANHSNLQVHGVMVPEKIKVTNYRSYRTAEFDFADVSFCTINGENGAGKSSLFMDAVVDCLYEEPRDGDLAGWISNIEDAKKGCIEFEFSIGTQRFRVVRTRMKSGRATLNLSELVDGEWKDRSREKMRDTQEEILKVIGMDSFTFKSCVLIMQDQYGVFMEAKPEKRMDILGDILGLEIYSFMEADAATLFKQANAKLLGNQEKETLLSAQMDALGKPEEELEEVKSQIELLTVELDPIKKNIAELQVALTQQEEYGSQISLLTTEIGGLKQKKTAAERLIEEQEKTIETCKMYLFEEPALKEQLEELDTVQKQLFLAEEKEKRYQEKKERHVEIKQKLSEELSMQFSISGNLEELSAQLKQWESVDIEGLKEKEKEYQEACQILAMMKDEKLEYERLQNGVASRIADRDSFETSYRQQLKMKEDEIGLYEKRAELLQNSGCTAPDNAGCRFLVDAIEATEALPKMRTEFADWKKGYLLVLDEKNREIEEAKMRLSESRYTEEKEREWKARLQELEKLHREYESRKDIQTEILLIRERICHTEKSLKEQQKKVENLKKELAAITVDATGLEESSYSLYKLKEKLTALLAVKDKYEMLSVYKERITHLEKNRMQYQEESDAAGKELHDKMKFLSELQEKYIGEDELRNKITALTARQTLVESDLAEKQRVAGGLEEKITMMEGLANQKAVVTKENQIYAREKVDYDVLKTAFNRKGVPHNIIRAIIPQMRSAANSILGQMTSGSMSMDFVTEKNTKSNKDKEIASLDIIIEEAGKGRLPYLSKSGGEKVKASLAAALALSEVKSMSMGIQSGMLFIDEPPFLDADGMQAYVDSLEAIQKRYRDVKIMAITHDPTMKARFPQSVDVVKTDVGSKVLMD